MQAETDRVASDVTGARHEAPSQVHTAPPAITWVARDTGEERLALAKEPSACATEKAASDSVVTITSWKWEVIEAFLNKKLLRRDD